MKSEMIGGYVFRHNAAHLLLFMNICVMYYNRVADLFVCRDEGGRIVSVALWTTPEQDFIGIPALLKHGFAIDLLKAVLKVGPLTVKRIIDLLSVDKSSCPKEPACYLFLIGSIARGAGREVMTYCIDYYRGNLLYWESAVPKDDHAYYKSFGAKPCGTVQFGDEGMMLFTLDTRCQVTAR